MLNPTFEIDWGYRKPAVDPEHEQEHQERVVPIAFHVRIAHLDPHTHRVTVSNTLLGLDCRSCS